MIEEKKSCSFCGWQGVMFDNDVFDYEKSTHCRIRCIHCGRATNWFSRRSQAVKAWNKGEIYRDKPDEAYDIGAKYETGYRGNRRVNDD